MKIRIISSLIIILCLAGLSTCSAATINVPDDYETIQSAIDAAKEGDTVIVKSGTYYESLSIEKRITLEGMDTGKGKPVVNAEGEDAITLKAEGITVEGFIAINSRYGIYLKESDGNEITNNEVNDNNIGIRLYKSSNNDIENNSLSDNREGIELYASNNNYIANNGADSIDYSFYLVDSDDNVISTNSIKNNDDWGIKLYTSTGNTISGNDIFDNQCGIRLWKSDGNDIKENNAEGNCMGVHVSNSGKNSITNNNFMENDLGINIVSSNNNELVKNSINDNGYGIVLSRANDNIIADNIMNNSLWDIQVSSSNLNTFEENTLSLRSTTFSFSHSGDLSVKGVLSPHPSPTGYNAIGKYVEIKGESEDMWLFLNVSYSDSDVSGIDESTLKIWRYDGSWNEDSTVERLLDVENNVVGINTTSSGVFAPFGGKSNPHEENKGDFDHDCAIGFQDFMEFSSAMNTESGDNKYHELADFDNDGDVDFQDFMDFAAIYEKSVC